MHIQHNHNSVKPEDNKDIGRIYHACFIDIFQKYNILIVTIILHWLKGCFVLL